MEQHRQACELTLRDALAAHNATISKELERAAYRWALAYCKLRDVACVLNNPVFMKVYSWKVRSLASNAPNFVKWVTSGEMTAEEVPYIHRHAMCPELWSVVGETNMRKLRGSDTDPEAAMTDLFLCIKCRNRKCTYMERQTRSADEATTVFVKCLVCHHSWKMS